MPPVVLVTGGTRGIGKAIATSYLTDHAVALTYNTTPPPAELADQALCIQADLSSPTSATDVVQSVLQQYGQLDIIVNNAGTITSTPKDDFDLADHRTNLDVNYLAPVALLAAALPHLAPGAAVVSVSSVNAVLPPRDAVSYGASKAALNLWTKAMAKELGPQGIRVNAVAPGAVERIEKPRPRDLIDLFVKDTALGRLATPEDIAAAVRFLASDAAHSITGEILTVSGGYRL